MKFKTSFESSFAVFAATLSRVQRVQRMGTFCVLFVFACLLISCGPVNQKPATDLAKQSKNMCDPQVPTDLAANPSPSGTPPTQTVAYSEAQHFIVSAQLADVDSGQSPDDQPSPMTDNLYVIRFVSGRNLTAPSAAATLTIQYVHQISTGPPNTYVADVAREGDHFISTIHFGQSGIYELHLHLVDGAIQDDHVVYVNP